MILCLPWCPFICLLVPPIVECQNKFLRQAGRKRWACPEGAWVRYSFRCPGLLVFAMVDLLSTVNLIFQLGPEHGFSQQV